MLLADIIGTIADEFEEVTQSYFMERPVKHSGNSCYSTDKGLCGGLNGNLFRELSKLIIQLNLLQLEKELRNIYLEQAEIY